MFFALYSNNKDYDEVYIQNYAKINLVPKLQRKGRSGKRYWCQGLFHENMDRSRKMSSYNIAPKDVQDALREQNVEAVLVKLVKMPKVFMNMSSNIKEDFLKLKITRISL
jgi:multidrug efflux pump subunit AcrB